MLYRIRAVLPVAILVFCLAGIALESQSHQPVLAASGLQPPIVQETEPEKFYIGSDSCFTCHRAQGGSWSETKHAKAFENLPEKYRSDSSCLKCHVTAFGATGGYDPGMSAADAQPFLSVGCESCHGPGSAHAAGVQRWMTADSADEEKLLKAMKAAIQKVPTDSLCADCHVGQAHQIHPPFDGQPLSTPSVGDLSGTMTSASFTPPPTPESYNVKTCGSCHYDQYQNWRTSKHVGLTAGIPAKYQRDQKCLQCHPVNQDTSQWHTPPTDPQANNVQTGVACESCHGSGAKHVLFNKQFITAPKLGPELELAARQTIKDEKQVAACAQCHVREGHGEHPKFEAVDVPQSK